MKQILTKGEVCAAYEQNSWQRMLFSEFESTLTSKSRPFPCVFGVSGMKSDQLRYTFLDSVNASSIAPTLREYIPNARSFGRMTSLVVFGRPGPVQGIEAYRSQFWDLLDDLERLDETARPEGVDKRLDTPSWEFCFEGEPIFVVCNTPAHVLRQSRRSTSFMITFQPRWVFEGITDSKEPAMTRALASVRERLQNFDAVPVSSTLGAYGASENREYQQYFIDDTNETPKCPFHALGQRRDEKPVAPVTDRKGKVA